MVEESDPEAHRKAQRRETRQMVGLVVLFTLIAAGGWWVWGKVTEADDNSQSAASPTATAPVDDVEAEVEAAYRAYIAMLDRLLESPDPDDPEIPQRTTGAAQHDIESFVGQNLSAGTIIRKGPAASETVLSIDVSGDEATLQACFIDESGAYNVRTGAELRPMTIVTSIDTVELQRVDGVWLVSLRRLPGPDEKWEGVSRCGR